MARGAQPPDPPSDGNDQSIERTRQIFSERSESAIGADLRKAREGLGLDLRQIASVLNIRYTHLEAIEQGRFDDLPGATYALGFVRAYATQLGLDSATVIERFKDEAEGIYRTTRLSFPEPVAEARIPGGAILLVSAFLAIVAYGSWYVYSANDLSIADLVPKVPERLMSLIDGDGAEPSQDAGEGAKQGERPKAAEKPATPPAEAPAEAIASKTPEAASPASPAAKVPPASGTAKKAPASDAAPAKPVETVAAPAVPKRTKPKPPAAEQTVAATPSPPKPSPASQTAPPKPAPPKPVVESAPAPAKPPVIIAAPDPVPPPETPTAPATTTANVAAVPAVPEVPGEAATPPPAARAYGAGNTGSRITVRAKSDSWIQVREANNTLLITRILRAGDSYRVPNLKGLRLMTGNAGALDILVDGKPVAPIGLFGVVRRRVLLDPERLLAGTAVAE